MIEIIMNIMIFILGLFICYHIYKYLYKYENFAWWANICYPRCKDDQICRDNECITMTNKNFQENVIELVASSDSKSSDSKSSDSKSSDSKSSDSKSSDSKSSDSKSSDSKSSDSDKNKNDDDDDDDDEDYKKPKKSSKKKNKSRKNN